MKQTRLSAVLHDPMLRVIATWIWWIVGGGLTMLALLTVLQIKPGDFRILFREYPHLTIYIETVGVGLLPLVITILCKDDIAAYGIQKKQITKSLLLSLFVVILAYGFNFIRSDQWININTPNFHLNLPWNLWYATLGVFAYGPLEVFFVVWLIANTDKIFKGKDRNLSWGLILTVTLFGLAHLATTSWIMALFVTVVFFLLGLIVKTTRNSIGPMVAWSLINTQVWFLAQLLRS